MAPRFPAELSVPTASVEMRGSDFSDLLQVANSSHELSCYK